MRGALLHLPRALPQWNRASPHSKLRLPEAPIYSEKTPSLLSVAPLLRRVKARPHRTRTIHCQLCSFHVHRADCGRDSRGKVSCS
jgi:hypothetical protein